MNRPANIQPRYVIAATAAVAILMLGSGFVELRQSRDELYHLLGESALALAQTIDRSGANNLLSTETMESLLAERLFDNALYIARLDSAGVVRSADLSQFAADHHLHRINIFDVHGTKVASSHLYSDAHAQLPEKFSPVDVLDPILKGKTERMVLGLREARVEPGQRYAVAIRRSRKPGGGIVVNLDAEELLRFRRTIGIGKLLKDLGGNSGIVYVAIQDTLGIMAAGGVSELSSINADADILQAIAADSTIMRVHLYDGTDVFEVVRPFAPEGVPLGVLRIGLTMDEVRSAEGRMFRRTMIMSLVVLVIGTLAFVFLVAQQNYQEMERRYRAFRTYTGNILAQMRDGVITVDPTGKVTTINASAAQILQLRTEELEGRVLKGDGGGVALMSEVFKEDDGMLERTFTPSGDRQRIIAVSLSTTRNAGGAVESRSAVLRDVTEARRLEREAQTKNRLTAMGELASGVAHEIRNPLNAIAMIAQRFSREFHPRSGVKEYRALTTVMQEEIQRVNRIIRQFLAFARPPQIQRRELAVGDLVGVIGPLFESQSREKGIHFTTRIEGNAPAVLDPELIKQALLNLLQNALDATPKGGRITLRVLAEQWGVQFVVEDNGAGMSPESLEKVFNLYHTTKPHGMGLGLPITHQIVTQHGGTIDVSSVEGKGTIFTLRIPR
jgi:two-component system, NtrC family, sensor histidine kinase HydH